MIPIKLLNTQCIQDLRVYNITDTSPIEYFVEVDLEYPHWLHDSPLTSENKSIHGTKYTTLFTLLLKHKMKKNF